jgi:hypothetical protein
MHYGVWVNLLDSAKNQKYVHIACQVSRVLSFSVQNGLECDFLETWFGFFSRIFLHQNVSV